MFVFHESIGQPSRRSEQYNDDQSIKIISVNNRRITVIKAIRIAISEISKGYQKVTK